MGPSGVPIALARVPSGSRCANARSRTPLTPLQGGPFQVEPTALFQEPEGVPIALKRVIITFKKLIQIDGAIGADDLHLAHDIPYALGSVRCVV